MPKLDCCHHCVLYADSPCMVCFVHPTGLDKSYTSCPDYRLKPSQQLALEEKLALLDWHPVFTGRCPSCEHPTHQRQCDLCGWSDGSEPMG